MNHSVYPIKREGRQLRFLFWSNNKAGNNLVLKIVSYNRVIKFGTKYYNVSLGDYSFERDYVFDNVTTNNGDMRKVIRTVVSTLEVFFNEHPNETVHIEGSDMIRNAFYQKIVRDYYEQIRNIYRVDGIVNGRIEPYKPGAEYDSLLVGIK